MTTDDDLSPLLRRRRIGNRLRTLREARGRTLEDVAAYLECSVAKVSRIETGRLPARIPDVRNMLDLYEITGPQRDELLAEVRQSRERGWWHAYADVMPEGMDTFIGFEDAADSMDWYEITLIPGILQTRDYITASATRRRDFSAERIARLIDLRMATQGILERVKPPRLDVVIDETALRRGPDDPRVMRNQLRRLIECGELPHITIQVVPFSAGFTACNIPFVMFGLPDPDRPTVVYTDQLTGGRYESRPEPAGRYVLTFETLRGLALDPAQSAAFIAEVLGELD